MDRKEIENEAMIRAREQIDGFSEIARIVTGNKEYRDQLESAQRFRAWARAQLGYTDKEGKAALEKERADMLQNLYVKNLQHLTDIDEHAKTVSDKTWRLIIENFSPIRTSDNKRLSWTQSENGAPSALEIVKEVYCNLPDDLVLISPRECLAKLIRNYDGQAVRYRYGTDEDGKAKVVEFRFKAEPKA